VPLHFPDQIVQSTQILSHLLLVVAIFPCRTHAQLDFPAQIVKSLQILSHLLLVVAIFPLPHPCAIRFPKSKSSNPHKSYLICFAVVAIQLFLILHHFPVVSPGVSLRCVSPGRRLELLAPTASLLRTVWTVRSCKHRPEETKRRDTTGDTTGK
jgi:nitrate reductase NapE component